jgi:excisionase family DNA binding protein
MNLFDCLRTASAFRTVAAREILFDVSADCPTAPTPTPVGEPKLLTARDAAKALAVCEKTLWTLTNQGELPVVRIGRSVRYDPRDLSAWITRNKSMGGDSSAAA